jgi:hypothetical protein
MAWFLSSLDYIPCSKTTWVGASKKWSGKKYKNR